MRKLLIVDDDGTLCGFLTMVIESRFDDLRVVAVRTCHDALRQARAVRPDIVVLDRRLPDGSGEDLLGGILSILPDAGVIVTSAESRPSLCAQAIRGGALAMFVKPHDPRQLLGVVAHAADPPAGRSCGAQPASAAILPPCRRTLASTTVP